MSDIDEAHEILVRCSDANERAEKAEAELAELKVHHAKTREDVIRALEHRDSIAAELAAERERVERLEKVLIGIASAANCTSLDSVRNAAREALRPAAPDPKLLAAALSDRERHPDHYYDLPDCPLGCPDRQGHVHIPIAPDPTPSEDRQTIYHTKGCTVDRKKGIACTCRSERR